MAHRWTLDNPDGVWLIICDEFKRDFSPKNKLFESEGKCPFCGKNARKELEERKRRKKERRREKLAEDKLKSRNTLTGYF